ncbi:hypothetical protein LCGC14_1518850, partial [marine sediment metagenome]
MNYEEFEETHMVSGSLSHDPAALEDLAKGKNTSPLILTELSKDESRIVRHYVATNPNTSSKVLTILSE